MRTLVLVGAMLQAAVSHAAVPPSNITSDGLGTAVTQAGRVFEIRGGTRSGNNLFHSFGFFTVGRVGVNNDIAKFINTTPALATRNILSRVTGGQPSNIFGTINTLSYPEANLFLINPAGVMFGPNATLEVGGSFHVSTADYLRFADGAKFFAKLSQESTLTTAAPVAFGFLRANPKGISMQGTRLSVPQSQTLSVVGGDVRTAGATLNAPNGRIHIASMASVGEVMLSIADQPLNLTAGSTPHLGQITMVNNTVMNSSGPRGGTVLIRGGRLTLDHSSINTVTTGNLNDARVGVLVEVGALTLTGGAQMTSLGFGAGRGGDVTVRASDSITISGQDGPNRFSGLLSEAGGSRAGGQLTISAPLLTMAERGSIMSRATGAGRGGDVVIQVGRLALKGGARIDTFTGSAAPGVAGGDVRVTADDSINISGPASGGIFSFGSAAASPSRPGDITLEAASLSLSGGARIRSGSEFGPPGGNVTVKARNSLVISDGSGISSVAFSRDAKPVTISAATLTMDNGFIDTSTVGLGNAGDISLNVGSLSLTRGAQIVSSTTETLGRRSGRGGDVNVTASGSISITGRSQSGVGIILKTEASSGLFSTASRTGTGNAGRVAVAAPTVTLGDGGKISVATEGQGDAGNLSVHVGRLVLTGGARIDSSTAGAGLGGNVAVTATDSVAITGPGTGLFSTASEDPRGRGGRVSLSASTVTLGDGAKISVATEGRGNAGEIGVNVGKLTLTGGARIDSSTAGAGHGGNMTVAATDSLAISGSASGLFSTASSRGDAGQIAVSGPTLTLGDGGKISVATSGAGNAGDIAVNANTLILTGGARIDSSTAGAGRGGTLAVVAADTAAISDGAGLFSNAEASGAGGNIALLARRVQLASGGTISAKSSGIGDAGGVTIAVRDAFVSRNSVVTTEARQADGGNVLLLAPRSGSLVHLTDSRITTSVGTGQGKGGNITIDPQFVILNRSQIRADAFGGPGGNILIVADVFLTQESILSASSALSAPGTINIQATVTDVGRNVARLPESALQAAALLRAACAARLSGGTRSSLVVAGRAGVPPEPHGALASPLLEEAPAGARLSWGDGQGWGTLAGMPRFTLEPSCAR